MPDQPRLATTNFYQVGASSNLTRFSFSADAFLIDHSNEQVYIPDDGSFEYDPLRHFKFSNDFSFPSSRRVQRKDSIFLAESGSDSNFALIV